MILYDIISEYDLLSMYISVRERCLSLSMRLTARNQLFRLSVDEVSVIVRLSCSQRSAAVLVPVLNTGARSLEHSFCMYGVFLVPCTFVIDIIRTLYKFLYVCS